jgi:hypothetical protein
METADPAVLGMLAELETVLAEAEELRYRILCVVRGNAPQASPPKQPVATPQPPATAPGPDLPTADLVYTGRGLWAWAKEHGFVDELVELGKHADFPIRMVDWNPGQVDDAIEALAVLITQPAPARSTTPSPATSSAHRPARGRRVQRNVHPSGR